MKIIYEGKVVRKWNFIDPDDAWRQLEEHAPTMPSISEMLKRVARDPVGQAMVFDLMVRLFLEHVLGASSKPGSSECGDGVAATDHGGLFGCVQGYFGPVETQGRGGLHAHIHVWILNPMKAFFLDKLRAGEPIEELEERMVLWRRAVLEKVATMQFDSVEEIGRQLDLPGDEALPQEVARERWAFTRHPLYAVEAAPAVEGAEDQVVQPPSSKEPDVSQWQLPPVPFSDEQRSQTYMNGWLEPDDRLLLPAPQGAPRDADWVQAEAFGPCRKRPYVPLADVEPDPHDNGTAYRISRRLPMTGAHLTLQPQWRRKPRYRTMPSGEAEIYMGDSALADSQSWSRSFALDARLDYIRSHIHLCKNTCGNTMVGVLREMSYAYAGSTSTMNMQSYCTSDATRPRTRSVSQSSVITGGR